MPFANVWVCVKCRNRHYKRPSAEKGWGALVCTGCKASCRLLFECENCDSTLEKLSGHVCKPVDAAASPG